MAGGVFAGVLGPQLVTHTMDLWQPNLFAATYLAQAAVAAIAPLVLIGVEIPMPSEADVAGGRSLAEIARQSRFITAVICGVVSYMVMNFLMTSAPLAMRMCGLSQDSANTGLQWHIIAMYAPGFVTGRLITRFGASRVVAVGLALIAVSAGPGLMGIDVVHFWLMLILLGVGLELRLRRRFGHGPRVSSARGADARPVPQRLPRLRHDDDRFAVVGGAADDLRMGYGSARFLRATRSGDVDAARDGIAESG